MHPGAFAETTPDKPALIMSTGEQVTFAELDAAANRLSRLLRSAGVEPGDHGAGHVDAVHRHAALRE